MKAATVRWRSHAWFAGRRGGEDDVVRCARCMASKSPGQRHTTRARWGRRGGGRGGVRQGVAGGDTTTELPGAAGRGRRRRGEGVRAKARAAGQRGEGVRAKARGGRAEGGAC